MGPNATHRTYIGPQGTSGSMGYGHQSTKASGYDAFTKIADSLRRLQHIPWHDANVSRHGGPVYVNGPLRAKPGGRNFSLTCVQEGRKTEREKERCIGRLRV